MRGSIDVALIGKAKKLKPRFSPKEKRGFRFAHVTFYSQSIPEGTIVMTSDLIALAVSRSLRSELKAGFLTISRDEVTATWREVSGVPGARLSGCRAQELEQALLEQGVRCVPSLTSTAKNVRLIRTGTLLGDIVDWVTSPSPDTDREVARLLTKVKGRWEWSRDTGELSA